LVSVKRPVWLNTVVSAAPMWHNAPPYYVHPEIDQTWKRLTSGLLSRTPTVESPRRIFVSRRPGLARRPCHNTPEVEAYFESHGFVTVFPEEFSLAEQARLFSGAQVVAGFGGSGMFNVMHARRMRTLVVLTHDAYDARNEYLFASILGCEVHYLWSSPDRPPRSQDDRDVQAVRSGWTFDFARNRSRLDEIMAAL
jgi:capsular polysaccharide biosynthesis protein